MSEKRTLITVKHK